MSGSVRRQARSVAPSSLEIVHAQCDRAVTCAARSEAVSVLTRSPRLVGLLKVAVALSGRVTDQDIGGIAARVPAERHEPARR